MASTSKCKKAKLQEEVKQEERNWLELPPDVTANILNRVGVFDILENAQKVCTPWRKICKDPAMWRVIKMTNVFSDWQKRRKLQAMCRHAVVRSQGQLVEISIEDFASNGLLQFIAERSSQLKRLEIACCYDKINKSLAKCLEKFPLLEELSLYITTISKEAIETAGRCCPNLRTLKVNQEASEIWKDVELLKNQNEIAIAIAENLRELRHLELIGNGMTKLGLAKILDSCSHLETLDLRQCTFINLKGDLGKKCSELIKCLKLPDDSLEGCPHIKGPVTDEFYDPYEEYGPYCDGGLTASDTDSEKALEHERAIIMDYYSL